MPTSVRDAVLARAARLDLGRAEVLDAAAVIGMETDLPCSSRSSTTARELAQCLAAGVLQSVNGGVGFRHELARRAVEEAIDPVRRAELHAQARAAPHRRRLGPARSPRRSGEDAAAVLEQRGRRPSTHPSEEPTARRRSSTRGACVRRCAILEEIQTSSSAVGTNVGHPPGRGGSQRELEAALEALPSARRPAQGRGAAEPVFTLLYWAARLGRPKTPRTKRSRSWRRCHRAELRSAYAHMADSGSARSTTEGVGRLGRARDRARRPARGGRDRRRGLDRDRGRGGDQRNGTGRLEKALTLAEPTAPTAGRPRLLRPRLPRRPDRHWAAQTAGSKRASRTRRSETSTTTGSTCWPGGPTLRSMRGRWDEAAADASTALDHPHAVLHRMSVAATARHCVLGAEIPASGRLLDEMSELTRRNPPQRRCRFSSCEPRQPSSRATTIEPGQSSARSIRSGSRIGGSPAPSPCGGGSARRAARGDWARAPAVRARARGDYAEAAALWEKLECPYKAARTLALSDDEDDLRRSHEALLALGARPAAAIVARKLRERGARGSPAAPARRRASIRRASQAAKPRCSTSSRRA